MRLHKKNSNTYERLGYEARKNMKISSELKENEGAMIRQTTSKNLPRTASVEGEVGTKKGG